MMKLQARRPGLQRDKEGRARRFSMKMRKKMAAAALAAGLVLLFCACGEREAAVSSGAGASSAGAGSAVSSGVPASSEAPVSSEAPASGGEAASQEAPASQQESQGEASSQAEGASGSAGAESGASSAVLYIGMNGSFTQYPASYTGQLTPEALISQISQLTGWNLELSDAVTTGKGGMTVSFSSNSSIVTGPPEPQKEEFFVYDNTQLIHTILDSVQRTLQYNFVDPELGDPASLDIYFCLEEGDIPLSDLGTSLPRLEPYSQEVWG